MSRPQLVVKPALEGWLNEMFPAGQKTATAQVPVRRSVSAAVVNWLIQKRGKPP